MVMKKVEELYIVFLVAAYLAVNTYTMKCEELKIWMNAQELYLELHKSLEKSKAAFVKQELLRYAMNVSTAISQGFERFSKTDFIIHLQKAKTNLAALKNLVHLANRVGEITKEQME